MISTEEQGIHERRCSVASWGDRRHEFAVAARFGSIKYSGSPPGRFRMGSDKLGMWKERPKREKEKEKEVENKGISSATDQHVERRNSSMRSKDRNSDHLDSTCDLLPPPPPPHFTMLHMYFEPSSTLTFSRPLFGCSVRRLAVRGLHRPPLPPTHWGRHWPWAALTCWYLTEVDTRSPARR